MLILDPAAVIAYGVLFVLVILAAVGFRFAGRKTGVVRLILRIVAVTVFIAGLLVTVAFRMGSDLSSFSSPIYSPDHKHALRIEDVKMEPGPRTTVYLYSNHGFLIDRVFYGTLGSVTAKDIHWLDNSSVLITYGPPSAKQFCASTAQVRVSAEPRTSTAMTHDSSAVGLDGKSTP
jgi:hypothetical protein